MGTTTSYQTSLPEYAKPAVERLIGKVEALTSTPYQTYGGERIARFDPMQAQAQQAVANLAPSQQIGTATKMAGLAGLKAGNMKYDAGQYGGYYNAPGAYQAGQFTADRVQAPSNLQYFQAQGPERVGTQSFLQPGTSEAYMSPYMQNVINATKRETFRDADIMRQQENATAAMKGAFGGSRHGIVDAERERNLGTRLSDIQTQGLQNAYTNAQQQFNADQARYLQAGMANQSSGLQTNLANLQANLGVQQLGAQQNLQAQLANQQYGLEAQRMAEASRQFGYGNQMTAAQLAAQYGLSGDQLSEQSRQFGANLGLQGLQQQIAAASQLGQLGQLEFNQQTGIINAMNAAGAQRQALQQQQYDQQYQDFLRQQQQPYQQLAFASDIYRGLPLTQYTQTSSQSPGSTASQVAGAGMAAYKLFGMAEGGAVESPAGLADLLVHNMR